MNTEKYVPVSVIATMLEEAAAHAYTPDEQAVAEVYVKTLRQLLACAVELTERGKA